MNRAKRWMGRTVLGLAFALGPVSTAAQDLPPDIQIDLFLVRAERHIQTQQWVAALEALDVVLALQADQGMETPPDLWLTHARVALDAGYPHTAVNSATRYLQEAGREGDDYESALMLLDEAQTRAEGAAPPTPQPTRTQTPTPTRTPTPARTPPPTTPTPPPTPAEPAPAPVAEPEASGAATGRLTVLFPMVGMNAANMAFTSTGPLALDGSRHTGVTGGFAVALPVLGDRYGVQIGAQYAQRGTQVALEGGATPANAEISFQSLDFTALARVSSPAVMQVANLRPYALLGPYASLEVDCRVAVEGSVGTQRFQSSDDCTKANLDTQSVDFGLAGGLGVEVGGGPTRINVGVLYSFGLQDIDKNTSETAKHRVLNMHIGVATSF